MRILSMRVIGATYFSGARYFSGDTHTHTYIYIPHES